MTSTDDAEIRNLIARFAEATDVGTLDEYADCLIEAATLIVGDAAPRIGRAEIVAAMETSRSQGLFGPGSGSVHVIGASAVVVTSDAATASTTFLFVMGSAGQTRVVATGRYADAFKRTDQGWRLARRTITV